MSFGMAAGHSKHIEVRLSPSLALCLHNCAISSRLQLLKSPQLSRSYDSWPSVLAKKNVPLMMLASLLIQ